MPVAARRSGSKRKLRPETDGGSIGPSASVTYEFTWRSLTVIGSRDAGLPAFSRRSRRATVSATWSESSQLSPCGAFGRAAAVGAVAGAVRGADAVAPACGADWTSQRASPSGTRLMTP